MLAVPGHTSGSIALHLPRHGVLITGDTVAEHEGQAILGPFDADRGGAWTSLQRLASLDVDVACPAPRHRPLRQPAVTCQRIQ